MITLMKSRAALAEVSPASLSAYARTNGWSKAEAYGDHSDVYVGDGLPEIILPRTRELGDYVRVVAQLLEIFAGVAERNEHALYINLVTAERDVVRVRANESGGDGTVPISDGAGLVNGARDMILAATLSAHSPRPLYRGGPNKEANDFLKQVRLGQTELGSFAITLLTPVIPPVLQEPPLPEMEEEPPVARRVTRRLGQALLATRQAMERTNAGDSNAFAEAVSDGASANLCEALVQLAEPFPTLDIGVSWALTRPVKNSLPVVRFTKDDVPILREAARSFRSREPQPDLRLFGFVQRLKRDSSETDGTVTLRVSIEGKTQSVIAVLNQSDYERAIEAHKEKEPIIVEGDLERFGQRWRLSNPRIVAVISREEAEED